MRILWINPSFLDYRVPVYEELNKLVNDELYIVYSDTDAMTPKHVSDKTKAILKKKAIGLIGAKIFTLGGGYNSNQSNSFSNKIIRLNYQPNLYKVVRECDVDVVIVEGFFQWSPSGYVKKLLQRTPLVLSYERTFHTERAAPKWRELYRKLIAKWLVNSAVVNGVLSKEYTHYLGVPEDKIVSGGMVADSHFFRSQIKSLNRMECRHEWGFEEHQLVFICVGRLINRKGVMELLHAWRNFKGNTLLIFAGDGELENNMVDFISEKKLLNVRLLGSIDYQKIPSLYLAADVFISSTLEDNWSLVVPEAMACGLPIACSKYNGCWPELVHEDMNGKVFDPLDPDDMLGVLNYFYKRRDQLDQMGKASEKIEAEFTPENAANAIFSACQIALKR